ncbi:MAG: type IV pilin protein [Xenococcaceae cyanobacterium]
MKTEFQAKLLQHLLNKKEDKGFTLIELLVVVIIVGILAAVALPNLLGQIGKSREVEGKNAIGAINRGQEAYHYEKLSFADVATADFGEATNRLGVVAVSDYYTFVATASNANNATQLATSIDATNFGTRNYGGGISYNAGKYDASVCQSDLIGGNAAASAAGGTAGCSGTNAVELK